MVNHHEHCWRSFSVDSPIQFDLPIFMHSTYLAGDLVAAGFRPAPGMFDYLDDPMVEDDAEQAWAAMRPYLDRVRSCSYYRYLLTTLDELFGISEGEILSDGWRDASARILAYSRQHPAPGADLSGRLGIAHTLLDAKYGIAKLAPVVEGDHRVLQVARMDYFIHPERGLAETWDKYRPHDLDRWLDQFDTAFWQSLRAGAAGIKLGLAYNRRIEFSDPPIDIVRSIFDRGVLNASPDDQAIYQDFMVNRLCQLCVEADVPMQIHSGIQAHNRHTLEDTRPTLLTSIFQRYDALRVDLFHGGYPWVEHAGLMAKYFPNVYVNGCWLSHISPAAYRRALTSWIETVPMTKIFAWGGDHGIIEHSYGAAKLGRELVAEVLAGLVERGYFDEELALLVGRRMLHDNAIDFWRISQ